jgi:hypothetical protein
MDNARQDIQAHVSVDHAIFRENQNVNIYYTQNFGQPTLSDDLRITINRDSLKVPAPHPGLLAPVPVTTVYTQRDHNRHASLNVTLDLTPAGLVGPLCAGDVIHLCLNLRGAVPGNVNTQRAWTLSHTLNMSPQTQANGQTILHFDGSKGNPAGFAHTCFDDLDLSDGELYFLYERHDSGQMLRSASSWIHVETISQVDESLVRALTLMAQRGRSARQSR